MLQNSRIAKHNGLKIYDINSIGTNKNPKANDVPCGKNKEKNLIPWVWIQIIFRPIKKVKLKVVVFI